jgi:hypothetical protein
MENAQDSDFGNPVLENRDSVVAWCGWSLPVRPEWRPLKIEGTHIKGSMVIGDATRPLVLVQWWRPGENFEAAQWLNDRFQRMGVEPTPDAPRPQDVDQSGWVRELAITETESKTAWYGYSRAAGLVVELVVTSLTESALRTELLMEMLPGLRLASADKPCLWSLFGASFVSPAGYDLRQRHLYSGDLTLYFQNAKGASVLLRQIYPGKLAVTRRPLEGWLDAPPFLERRRIRTERRISPVELPGGMRKGLRQTTWKRLPWPLGWCRPRYCTTVAVLDEPLDRLLIADYQAWDRNELPMADQAVANMNGPSDGSPEMTRRP